MKINILVGSLVLDGFDYSNYEQIVAALENGLAKLAKDDNFSRAILLESAGRRSTKTTTAEATTKNTTSFKEPIRIESNSDPSNVGNEIARSIYSRIFK